MFTQPFRGLLPTIMNRVVSKSFLRLPRMIDTFPLMSPIRTSYTILSRTIPHRVFKLSYVTSVFPLPFYKAKSVTNNEYLFNILWLSPASITSELP